MTSCDARVLNALDDPDGALSATSRTANITEQSRLISKDAEGRRYEGHKTNALSIYAGPEISDRECIARRAPSPPELVPLTRNVHDYVKLARNIKAINLTLVNRGSVARDHLASERTFLAYVRTSLGLSSAGVALMQFMRLGNSTESYAAPIGVVAILTGLLTLLFGMRRFFLVQQMLVDGRFPPSIWEMTLISFMLGSIIAVAFGVLIGGGLS